MRSDMANVIIDRPRTGGNRGKSVPPKGTKRKLQKALASEDCEQLAKRESNAPGRVYGYDCKQLNEHLSPLRRYILSCVGRKWDEVFSDICKNISQDSAVQSHVRDHVFDYVETQVVINKDGKLSCKPSNKHRWYVDFLYKMTYVHPTTGVLCRNESYFARQKRKPKQERVTRWIPIDKDGTQAYYKADDGIWYKIKVSRIPGGYNIRCTRFPLGYYYYRPQVWDILLKTYTWEGCGNSIYPNMYCVAKQQIDKRTIKRIENARSAKVSGKRKRK
jgi:hypothetical protein